MVSKLTIRANPGEHERKPMTEFVPFAVSISEAVRMVGLGRTSLYAAIAAGKLKTRKSGRRTLVETSALQRVLEELPTSDRPSNVA